MFTKQCRSRLYSFYKYFYQHIKYKLSNMLNAEHDNNQQDS